MLKSDQYSLFLSQRYGCRHLHNTISFQENRAEKEVFWTSIYQKKKCCYTCCEILDYNSGRAVWADVNNRVHIKYKSAKSKGQAADWWRPRLTSFVFKFEELGRETHLQYIIIDIYSVLWMEETILQKHNSSLIIFNYLMAFCFHSNSCLSHFSFLPFVFHMRPFIAQSHSTLYCIMNKKWPIKCYLSHQKGRGG